MFDFHLHSNVSFDSETNPSDIIQMAEKLGLKEIQRERDFICYVPQNSVWLKQM